MIDKMDYDYLVDFINSIPTRKMNDGKTFDTVFNINGMPYFMLVNALIKQPFLPKFIFDQIPDIIKKIELGTKEGIVKNIKSKLLIFLLRKYLMMSEQIKSIITKRSTLPSNENRKVLFLTFTNQVRNNDFKQVYALTELIPELRKRKIEPLFIVQDPFGKISFKKIRELDFFIYNYVNLVDKKEVKNLTKKIRDEWINRKGEVKKIFWDSNHNLFPYFKEYMEFLFSEEIVHLVVLYLKTFELIIKTEKIDLVFVTNDASIVEKTALAAANKCSIPSFLSGSGMGCGDANYPYFKKAYFGAFGSNHVNYLIKQKKVNRGNIKVTGSLLFNQIIKNIITKPKKKQSKTILFFTQAVVEKNMLNKKQYFNCIKFYLQQLSNLDAKIILRLHPDEKLYDIYEDIIKSIHAESKIEITQGNKGDQSILDLIANSDVIISLKSSTIYYSMILHKPVICINLLDTRTKVDYNSKAEDETILKVGERDNIEHLFINLLNNRAFRKKIIHKQDEYINSFFDKLDGRTPKRVAQTITKILDREKKVANN